MEQKSNVEKRKKEFLKIRQRTEQKSNFKMKKVFKKSKVKRKCNKNESHLLHPLFGLF